MWFKVVEITICDLFTKLFSRPNLKKMNCSMFSVQPIGSVLLNVLRYFYDLCYIFVVVSQYL